jgi:hypothetical protein
MGEAAFQDSVLGLSSMASNSTSAARMKVAVSMAGEAEGPRAKVAKDATE